VARGVRAAAAPDDPQMVALDEEWARVIASRHTDGSTAAEETEAELDGGPRKHGRSRPITEAAPQPPPRPVKMTSSDTETERRAGEIDMEMDVKRRRKPGH